MASFFKTFGKGVLAIILIPVFVLVMAIMAVFGFIGFIVMSIRGLFLFFTGRNLYDDLPEDKKAKETIARLTNKINPEKQEQVITPEPQRVANQEPFFIPEYMKTPINQPDKEIPFNQNNIPQIEPEWEEEILVPKQEEIKTFEPVIEEEIPTLEREEELPSLEEETQKEAGFVGENDNFIPKMPTGGIGESFKEDKPEQLSIFDDDEGSTNFKL